MKRKETFFHFARKFLLLFVCTVGTVKFSIAFALFLPPTSVTGTRGSVWLSFFCQDSTGRVWGPIGADVCDSVVVGAARLGTCTCTHARTHTHVRTHTRAHAHLLVGAAGVGDGAARVAVGATGVLLVQVPVGRALRQPAAVVLRTTHMVPLQDFCNLLLL